MQSSLTFSDKEFFKRKFEQSGLTTEEAKLRIDNLSNHLRQMMNKVKREKIPKEKLNELFLIELEKFMYK